MRSSVSVVSQSMQASVTEQPYELREVVGDRLVAGNQIRFDHYADQRFVAEAHRS